MSLLIKKTLAILIIILSGFVRLTLTNEFRTTESAVALINSLLNHTSECPGNVTKVNNTHIKKTSSQKIGLCPFELTINYDERRKPEVIVEAKCKSCLKSTCSTRHVANCETLTEEIDVRYLNHNITLERSIGCFCVSHTSSQQINEKTRPHPRRRRHTSK